MVRIHEPKVVQCPSCKKTKIISSHGDVVIKIDIPTCETCSQEMTFVKIAKSMDWILHPKDFFSRKKIK